MTLFFTYWALGIAMVSYSLWIVPSLWQRHKPFPLAIGALLNSLFWGPTFAFWILSFFFKRLSRADL